MPLVGDIGSAFISPTMGIVAVQIRKAMQAKAYHPEYPRGHRTGGWDENGYGFVD
jgi:hypothetical protein